MGSVVRGVMLVRHNRKGSVEPILFCPRKVVKANRKPSRFKVSTIVLLYAPWG